MHARLIGLATLGCTLLAATAAQAQPVKVGKTFPNFTGNDLLTGKRVSLEELRGKVVLIDFWATWCGPCITELPNVKQAYEKYHKQGFEIISISLDNDVNKCKRFVERENMDWMHIADGRGWRAALAVRFGVRSIPTMYLLGKDGEVISNKARGPKLHEVIKKALEAEFDPQDLEDDVEREAKTKLQQADDLRTAGRYAEALKLYDAIGLDFLGRPTAELANERSRELRENPDIQKALKRPIQKKLEAEATRKADRWLRTARSMKARKNYTMARRYYQRIIENYADSPQARIAARELKKLPK